MEYRLGLCGRIVQKTLVLKKDVANGFSRCRPTTLKNDRPTDQILQKNFNV